MRVPRAARQRGMLPLRAVSERAFTASRELDSILPKVYDIYLANNDSRLILEEYSCTVLKYGVRTVRTWSGPSH